MGKNQFLSDLNKILKQNAMYMNQYNHEDAALDIGAA